MVVICDNWEFMCEAGLSKFDHGAQNVLTLNTEAYLNSYVLVFNLLILKRYMGYAAVLCAPIE